MIKKITKDGSYTIYNDKKNECYHSLTGAEEEAFEKYVKPLKIEDNMTILDFCFGLGYNSFAAIYDKKNLKITALEKDINIIKLIESFPYPQKLNEQANDFSQLFKKNNITDKNNNNINLIIGDAKETIKNIPKDNYDVVFFDPFSPLKSPQLWTVSIFESVYKSLKLNGKLATYSCNKLIRANMKKVGFKIIDGPRVGRKSPGTIAIKI